MPQFTYLERQHLLQTKGTICCNCLKDEKNNIIYHHIIPLVIGGNNIDSNIVPLCTTCHMKLHNISDNNQRISHSELTKIGLEKAKQRGVQLGRAKGTKIITQKQIDCKKAIIDNSFSFNGTMTDVQLINKLQIARNTFYKYKREIREELNKSK